MSKKLILWLLSAILLSSASIVQAQTRSGLIRLTRVGPKVNIKSHTSDTSVEGFNNDKITEENTVLTTGPSSQVILVFSNGATINLKEDSELNIETFKQDPFAGEYSVADATSEPPAKSVTRIKLTRGELVGNVKSLRHDLGSEFTVSTPAGAAGIRGTTFRVIYRPQGNGQAFFSVMTVEGDVLVTTTTAATSLPVSVGDQQEVVITVDVDDSTGAVTVVTAPAEIVATPATAATVAAVTTAFQQNQSEVITVVLTAVADQVLTPLGGTQPPSNSSPPTTPPAETPPAETPPAETPPTKTPATPPPTKSTNDPTPGAGG